MGKRKFKKKEKKKQPISKMQIKLNTKKGFLLSMLITIGIAYIFYNSIVACILFIVIYPIINSIRKKEFQKMQEQLLKNNFKDMMQSLEAALQAGYSVENAMVLVYKEMKVLLGEKSLLVSEISKIIKEIETNIPIENALLGFANRCKVEEISDFVNTFTIGKRIGGNLGIIISDTVFVLSQKIDTEREIQVHLAARKFEFLIMCTMPFCIILYIRISAPDYFSSLYNNLFGILFMTGILGIMGGAYFLGQNLLEVKV